MAKDPDIYFQDRAVVFLDVLGFQDKLRVFEQQAIENKANPNVEYFISDALNEFIDTFRGVVSFLDDKNFTYYLFSDNICITVDYVENNNRLIEILVTINDLFLKFARKGYFLRGGIDVGKFVDEESIAIGVPLATAYKLEQDVAIYPRVVLSDNYKNLLDTFEQTQSINADSIAKKAYLINQHCEVHYVNTFANLLNNEDKFQIMQELKTKIEENLTMAELKEKVAVKYEWLAREFNAFIDEYLAKLHELETNFDTDEEELAQIKSLKIEGYAK